MATKRLFLLKMINRELKYLSHLMRKGGLENGTLTVHIECKDRRKQRETYLWFLDEWMPEQAVVGLVKRKTLLRATDDRA